MSGLSVLIYAQVLIVTVIFCVIALPFLLILLLFAGIFNRRRVRWIIRFFMVWYGKAVIRIGLWPYVRIRYENVSGEPPERGIYIFNHRSSSDPFLVAAVVNWNTVQAVNKWPMKLPFFGFFARLGGYYDITSMGYEEALERTRDLLAENIPIVVFPEGTRSGNRGMNPFHGLFFRLAKELNVPLIPVAVAGNEKIPTRDFRMHTGKIRIRKLRAIDPDIVRKMPPYQLKNHVREILLRETKKMDELLDHEKQQ